MNKKKVTSLFLAVMLVFSTVFSANDFSASASAAEKNAELVTVYLAAQGTNAAGTSVNISKVATQVAVGTTADILVKNVLDCSGYQGNYELLDTGYGPYLESINGMGTEQEGSDYYYWSFYINGDYSSVGLGSYELKDNDKISLIYTYQDSSMQAKDFMDDVAKNPAADQAIALTEVAKKQQTVLAEAVYQSQFGKEDVVPGIENTNGLYTVFSLIRAGYEKPEFYQAVYQKIVQQLYELKETGKTTDPVQNKDITEESILEDGYAELYYAKIVLAVSAMGMDAADVGGFNLIEKMAQKKVYDASAESYTREATMLLALDSSQYVLPTGDDYVTRTELVNKLADSLDVQIATSIQWGVDMAAMTIQPLAPYTVEGNLAEQEKDASYDREKIAAACSKGIHFLESMQSAEGLYGDSWSPNNAWSLAQVMTTLGQFGISPVSEEDGSDFIKNGKTVLDAASEFVDEKEETVDESLMGYQPEQLLRGLNACIRVIEGENVLYDTKDVAKNPLVSPVTPTPIAPVTPPAGQTSQPTNTPVSPTPTVPGTGSTIVETKSLKVAKSSVVVAPGKSVQVGYTVQAAGTATAKAVVTVTTGNKKVATAQITDAKVKITAPKNAVKGSSTKVTVTSGAKKAVVKVTVKNRVKSVKAKKKTITVKKGKKAKAVVTVKAQNTKKAVTDKVKVTVKKKQVKVTQQKTVKGKVTVTIQGLKKGRSTMTVKVGRKKAKFKVVVLQRS